MRSLSLLFLAAAALAGAGCGDDGGIAPDGGIPSGHSLEILNPPGESIGLPFNQSITLRVRYRDDEDEPIADAEVEFSILTSMSEKTGGSTISANAVITDDMGIARIDVSAGAERANFRVEVNAQAAPAATFFIAISEVGFTNLQIVAEHSGPRELSSFDNVQLRLYQPADLVCDALDFDALPPSVFPLREGAFGEQLVFENLAANEAYTLVAWAATSPDGAKVSTSCIELGAAQVPTAPSVSIRVVITDRPLQMPAAATVSSTFGLDPVRSEIDSALPADPWRVLSCPLGAAQLLIDCTLDAHTNDGTLDCVPTGPDTDGLVADVEAERGPVDVDGCRPALSGGATDSIDKIMSDALTAGGWAPSLTDDLVAARDALLDSFDLTSVLEFFGDGSARHRLVSASVTIMGTEVSVDLTSTARPVIEQDQVSADADFRDLSIGAHSFTLRYGSFGRDAFTAGGLEPNGLGDRAADLGTALAQSVDDGGAGGCPDLSGLLCATGAHAATCAQAACSAAATALDTSLFDWAAHLDGTGFDLQLSGAAGLSDPDDDLAVDAVEGGTWQAAFTMSTGAAVNAVGSFGAAP